MIKRIFTAIAVLILLNGCVGTLKIAEEESVKGQTQTPVYTKPIEDHNSSIKKK